MWVFIIILLENKHYFHTHNYIQFILYLTLVNYTMLIITIKMQFILMNVQMYKM